MFHLEHVFVPIDFSRSAQHALSLISKFSPQEFSTQVVHALGPWPKALERALFPYAALGEDKAELEHQWLKETEDVLYDYFGLKREALPVNFKTPRVVLGQPFDVLPKEVSRTSADLVVMGAFGESGARPEVLGATASAMLNNTTRPLLLAKDPAARTIKKIVCALDLSSQCSQVLDAALSLAMTTGAQVEAVFVLADPLAQDPHGLLQSHVRYKSSEVLRREKPKLDALFDRAFQEIEVPYVFSQQFEEAKRQRRVLHGEPARTLVDHCDEHDVDLIVLGTRSLAGSGPRQGRIGQVCWDVARRSTSHVMVVPIEPVAHLLNEDES